MKVGEGARRREKARDCGRCTHLEVTHELEGALDAKLLGRLEVVTPDEDAQLEKHALVKLGERERALARAAPHRGNILPQQALHRARMAIKLEEDTRARVRDEVGVLGEHGRHRLALREVRQLGIGLVGRSEDVYPHWAQGGHHALDHHACDLDGALRGLLALGLRGGEVIHQLRVAGPRLVLVLQLAPVVKVLVEFGHSLSALLRTLMAGVRLGAEGLAVEYNDRTNAAVDQELRERLAVRDVHGILHAKV